jgi:hypothetical protein
MFFLVGTTNLEYTITDASGNTDVCSFSVEVIDNEAPEISCAADQNHTNDNGVCEATIAVVAPTLNDNCGIASFVNDYNGTASGDDTYPVGQTTLTWTVTDVYGISNTCQQIITVNDTEKPDITCPDPLISQCKIDDVPVYPDFTEFTLALGSASDNCSLDASSFVHIGDVSDGLNCPERFERTYLVADTSGNTNTCIQIIEINDITPPTASAPADSTYTCLVPDVFPDAPPDPNVVVDALDNCTAFPLISHIPDKDTLFGNGCLDTLLRTYSVADDCGNAIEVIHRILIKDTVPPEMHCNDLITYLDNSGLAMISIEDVNDNSFDNCSSISFNLDQTTFDCSSAMDSPITVELSGTDNCGNTGTCQSQITVLDTISPRANCITFNPFDPFIAYLDNSGQASISPLDIDDGSSDICGIESLSLDITDFDCSNLTPTNDELVTLTVMDSSGNTSTCTAIVLIEDTIAPTFITCPSDTSVFLFGSNCSAPAVWPEPIPEDNCSFTWVVRPPTFIFETPGIYPIEYKVADNPSGNEATCSFNVTILDTIPPDITPLEADTAENILNLCFGSVSVPQPDVDDCSENLIITNDYNGTDDASDVYPVGTTLITWTAVDVFNNTSTATQEIVVVDVQKPVLTYPEQIITCEDTIFYAVTAFDNCNVDTIKQIDGTGLTSGSEFPVGETIQQYVAIDLYGNSDTCEFIVRRDFTTIPGFVVADTNYVCQGSEVNFNLEGYFGNSIQWQIFRPSLGGYFDIPGETDTSLSLIVDEFSVVRTRVKNGTCDAELAVGDTVRIDSISRGGLVQSTLGQVNIQLCEDDISVLELLNYRADFLQWQLGTNTDPPVWSDIAGANADTFVVDIEPFQRFFYRVVVSNGLCSQDTSTIADVRMDPQPLAGVILTGDTVLCEGMGVELVLQGDLGLPQWQFSDLEGLTWTNLPAENDETLLLSSVTDSLLYRVEVTSGSCDAVYSDFILVGVHPMLQNNLIQSDQDICENIPAESLTGTLPIGGDNTYAYQWQMRDFPDGDWEDIVAATGAGLDPGLLNDTLQYRRFVESGKCTDAYGIFSDIVQINFHEAITQNAIQSNQSICTNDTPDVLLGSSPLGGDGTMNFRWEQSTDSLFWVDATQANDLIDYQPEALLQTHWYRRIVTSGPCNTIQGGADTSNAVKVKVNSYPIAFAGDDFETCGDTVSLSAIPTPGLEAIGTWTSILHPTDNFNDANDPTTLVEITPDSHGIHQFEWKENNNGCISIDTVDVVFWEKPQVEAGEDQLVCGLTTNLEASIVNPSNDNDWTYSGPGVLTWDAIDTTLVTADEYGFYTLRLTSNNGVCTVIDSLEIEFTDPPVAAFSSAEELCSGDTLYVDVMLSGIGPWQLYYQLNGENQVLTGIQASDTTLSIVLFETTIIALDSVKDQTACTGLIDEQTLVTVYQRPVVNAGENQLVCGLSTNLEATLDNPANQNEWTYAGPGTLTWDEMDTTLVTADQYGDYTLFLTSTNGVCLVQDSMELSFIEPPNAVFTNTNEICSGESIDVSLILEGTGPWTLFYSLNDVMQQMEGINTPDTTLSIVLLENTTLELDSVQDQTACTGFLNQSLDILVYPIPVLDAGENDTLCWDLSSGSTYILNGSIDNGDVIWNYEGPAGLEFEDALDPSTSITITELGEYHLFLYGDNGNCEKVDSVVLIFQTPDILISEWGPSELCDGESSFFTVRFLKGSPPFTLDYREDGIVKTIVSESNEFTEVISRFTPE